MRRRTYFLAVFAALFIVCCSDDESEESLAEESVSEQPSRPVQENTSETEPAQQAPDTEPPILRQTFEHTVLSWGRARWSWTAAVDNETPRHQMDYRIVGSVGSHASSVEGSVPEPVEIQPPTGSIEYTASAPVTHTVWQAHAVDNAGNVSAPLPAQHILLRPRLHNLLTGGVDGRLKSCFSVSEGELFCGGEFGRYATWDGSDWLEGYIDTPSTVRLARDAEGGALIVTDHGRYRFGEEGLEPLEDEFTGRPTPPMGRTTVEPSGLFLWVDGDGRVWGTDGSRFQLIDNPLLVSSEERCDRFNDIYFSGQIGFAWCSNGNQYAMRVEQHGYRWQQLGEANTLSAEPGFQRAIAFGGGRQITLLTWGGDVLRYEMGGWHTLLAATEDRQTASMARSEDPQQLLVGVDRQILSVNGLGETEVIAELPISASLIYIAPPEEEALVVSENGEVVRVETQELLYAPPGGGLKRRYMRQGKVAGIWASLDGDRLFKWNAPSWSVREIETGDRNFVMNGLVQLADGTLYLAGETAEGTGRIGHLSPLGFSTEPFLYPPPPPEPGEGLPDETELDGEVEGGETGELGQTGADAPVLADELSGVGPDTPTGEEATSLPGSPETQPTEPPPLVGVLPAALREAPTIPPPLTAIDWDPESGTAVAVGMGGSLWYRLQYQISETTPLPDQPPSFGWLQIETGVFMPFLTVRVLGPGHYLVGGADGLVLECHEALCEMSVLQVGDVVRFTQLGEDWVALGTIGLARRDADLTWQPLILEFAPPFPLENPPDVVLSVDERDGRQWVLGTDGTIWMGELSRPLWAMGVVVNPVDLWIDNSGRVVVAT